MRWTKLLFLSFSLVIGTLNAQSVKIRNHTTEKQNIAFLLEQEKNFDKDTLALRNYYAPLLQNQSNRNTILHHIFMANGYKDMYDSITPKRDKLYKEAVKLATKANNKALSIWAELNYVKYLYHYIKYQEMLPYLLHLREEIAQTDPNELLAPGETYTTLGWIMQTLSDYQEAQHYLELALQHVPKNTSEYASILDNFGGNWYKYGNSAKTLYYFNKAETMASQIKDSLRYAKVLGNKARIYEDQKQYDKAIALLKKDIDWSKKVNDKKNIMFASIILGRIYLKTNQLQLAKSTLDEAYSIAVSNNYYQNRELEIIKLKLELVSKNHNTTEELHLRRRMVVLEDSLKKADGEAQIHALNWQIQKDKYRINIKENQNKQQKLTSQKRILIIIAAFLVVLALFIYLFQKTKHKSQEKLYEEKVQLLELEKINIEKTLHDTHHNLSYQVDYIKQKNNQIRTLKAEIETIKESSSYYLEEQNGKLKALLDSHLMTDQNWIAFKREFDSEHPKFTQKLIKDYPELTDANLRILYLQKLGFESSDIAEALGITTEAIKKSRQRLKKKLSDRFDKLMLFIQK